MKKRTRNILIGTGITAGISALASAVSFHTTNKLMKVALDRPKNDEKENSNQSEKRISGTKIDSEFYEKQRLAAEKLKYLELEDVKITTVDGTELVAHWYGAENAKRTIIAMHGWRSSWTKDFAIISEFWHANNCNVLYVEQRGQNNSGGDYMGFGMLERYDCLDWVSWVIENKSNDLPIYLCGISMGASTVLMAGGLNLPENVHGIMADCGYTSPHEIWKHVVEKNLKMYYGGIIGRIADDICRRKIQVGSRDVSCVDAMENCKTPVFFVHGTDDHFVPVEMTFENYKACNAPKKLLVVPGAEHGMSYIVEQDNYENAVLDFWEEFDER